MVNLLRHKTFTLICLLWLEGLELSQVNLSGLSSSLWLTFEKVEGSQASTSQQSQQFPTTHTGTQRKTQLLRVHLPLFSNPVTHYSPQNKRQQHSSPQHTKSLTIAWCSEHVPTHFALLSFLFRLMMPLQQRSLLCSQLHWLPTIQPYHKGSKNCF